MTRNPCIDCVHAHPHGVACEYRHYHYEYLPGEDLDGPPVKVRVYGPEDRPKEEPCPRYERLEGHG